MKTIALVAGGYSGEYDISLQSAEQVEQNLQEDFVIYKIIITKDDWYYEYKGQKISVNRNDFSLVVESKKICFDAVFIIVHGTPGENGLLQGYFDMIGMPYNTCDALCSAVTFDKMTCNALVRDFNVVNVAKNCVVFKEDYFKGAFDKEDILKQLSLPVFVKPSQGGSSLGTFKVSNEEELESAIEQAFKVHHKVLIEEFIKGQEFSCGVLTVGGRVMALPVTEIIPQTEFFDYQAKYDGFSQEIVPAPIDEKSTHLIQSITEKLYKLLNCKGVCRVDYILDTQQDKLFFLEINTTPGQSLHSIVPNQVRQIGKDVHWLYKTQMDEVFRTQKFDA